MSNPPPTLQYQSHNGGFASKERIFACRALKVLGGLCIVAGLLLVCAAVILCVSPITGMGVSSGISYVIAVVLGVFALLVVGLGVLYWVSATKISQFSRAAAMLATVISSIHLGLISAYVVLGMYHAAMGRFNVLSLIIPLLFAAGLSQLLFSLAKVRREVA